MCGEFGEVTAIIGLLIIFLAVGTLLLNLRDTLSYTLATRALYFLKKRTRNGHFPRLRETSPYVLQPLSCYTVHTLVMYTYIQPVLIVTIKVSPASSLE